MTKLQWATVQRKVKDLLPFKKNPRKMSEKQISDLKKSIQKFNLVEIPAIDTDNKIISGHQRLAVMQLLGRGDEIIDVRYPNRKLSELEYKQYMISSNAISGDWDEQLLFENFDTDLLLDSGFDNIQLDNMFSEILDTEDDEFDVKKQLSEIKKPKSKLGDLFQIGPHRLYCGNSEKLESVQKVVGDEKIHLIYNDPIYNIDHNYKSGIGGTKNYGGSVKDKRTDKEYSQLLENTMKNALAVSHKDVHIFYYCDQFYVPMIASLYKKLGVRFRRICIWLKFIANPTPQIAFSKVYEPCVYATKGRPFLSPNHKNFDEVLNKEIGTGNHMEEQVTDMIDVWATKRLSGTSYEHSTEKPISLHDKPIRRCTKIGDNILSLFGGSGGEMVAAHQLKRNCFMVEQDPVFVDLIISRMERLTGIKAKKVNYEVQ